MISNGFDERFEEFTGAEDVVPALFEGHGFSVTRLDKTVHANPDWLVWHAQSRALAAVEVKVSTTPVFYNSKSQQIEARHGVHVKPLDLLLLDARHVAHYRAFTAKTGIPVYLLYIATWQPKLVFFDDLGSLQLYSAGSTAGAASIRGVQTDKLYVDAAGMRPLADGLEALSADLGCPCLYPRATATILRVLKVPCVQQITYPASLSGAAEVAKELVTAQTFYHPAGRWRRAAG